MANDVAVATLAATARDAAGTPIPGKIAVFTVGGSANHLSATSATTNASGLATVTLTSTKAETKDISVTIDGVVVVQHASLVFASGPAASLTVTAASPQTAGTPFTVTVTAKDQFANVATGYAGTVHFTTSDPAAELPANATLTSGVRTFVAGVTLKTVPTQTVSVTDTVDATVTGTSSAISVSPGGAASFTVTAGSPQTAGTPFTVTVTAKDQFANVATGYAGTVHFTTSDPAAVLPANATLTSGVRTFVAGVTFKTVPTQTVSVTDTVDATVTGTSSAISVSPGATASFLVNGFPTPGFAGLAGNLVVTALDQFGNVTPGYSGTVHLTSADPAATLPADATLNFGTRAFSLTLYSVASSTSVTATDTTNATITGSQSGITVLVSPLVFSSAAATVVGGTSAAGKVFITGGNTLANGLGTSLRNTWLFDPATSALSAGPTLTIPRAFHTATAIGAGQVLLAGGVATGGTEFELCDLVALTCSATGGALATSRCNAAAALVSASPARVLIAGGDNCAGGSALRSWDLWDGSGAGSPVSSGVGNQLTIGRQLLTATALGGGKVLLAGGSSTTSADVFVIASPSTASTVTGATGAMNAVRSGHTATPLAPGVTTACPVGSGCVLIAGGLHSAGKSWEVYDAASNTFPLASTTGHDLVVPLRSSHVATQFASGKVLLAGGTDGSSSLASTEVFNPAAATLGFASGFVLQQARLGASAAYTAAQDLLNVAGGSTAGPPVEQVFAP